MEAGDCIGSGIHYNIMGLRTRSRVAEFSFSMHKSMSSPNNKSWHLIDSRSSSTNSPRVIPDSIEVSSGKFSIDWSAWNDGPPNGMKCLTIDTGAMKTTLLPARGMGIWKCWSGNTELGWQSPVRGPVHPSLVPIGDPSGIGWLEGFDELLVRCGLFSNGAPEFTEQGNVRYSVHGRIANLPAHSLRVEVDPEAGLLEVIGTVTESRFLVYTLELESRIRFKVNSSEIEITDKVTNPLTSTGTMQLLYHINLGQPLLQAGSMLVAALETVAPRDSRAAEGIGDWSACQGPQDGYREQVYYSTPMADENHWTEAMLTNSDGSLGYSVHFDTRTLPCLNFWKNTAGVEDGYVLGIEPATGFPNTKSFEEQQSRVVRLQGGQSRTFRLKLQPHWNQEDVGRAKQRIQGLQSMPMHTEPTPKLGWSPGASS